MYVLITARITEHVTMEHVCVTRNGLDLIVHSVCLSFVYLFGVYVLNLTSV